MVSKNRQHFDFKNFLIRCILDYAQRHLVDFWKKRPANFDFIWLEWNSYNSSIQIHIVWSRSSIFKLKSCSREGCNGSSLLLLPLWKNQRLRGARVAWVPKNVLFSSYFWTSGGIRALKICVFKRFIWSITQTTIYFLFGKEKNLKRGFQPAQSARIQQ